MIGTGSMGSMMSLLFAELGIGVAKALGGSMNPRAIQTKDTEDRDRLLRDLHDATYAAFFLAFGQGLHTIEHASQEQRWGLTYLDVLQLWRGGCIIRSDYIIDLLETVYRSTEVEKTNLLAHPRIAEPLRATFPALINESC
ncbi:Dehydrogenase, multihelical [Niveomyces insectorum RCEF 264]|uniref:phosphogluconate dehydrogenase (NADP(+)-dependent, decarboxylating) n=1 Tax=Niveomyces insectorum RCEF 264 TaxID=1081102 RepID=A0A167TH51_9HYPO|nr:Dehydrogenase, multihelical [Niveomyces insectorum RCEF 264]